jgi:hypothetical protein
MSKAPSTKNIEKALGIADDLTKLNVSSDDEKKKQFEERQKKLKDIQEQFQKKRATYEQDKDFIKDMYREIAESGMIAVRIMQEEAGMTGDYKNVEAMASMVSSVASALDGLKNVELDEEKLRIEKDKVNIRRDTANSIITRNSILNNGSGDAPGGQTVNNIVHVGSTGDLIRMLKQAEKDEAKTVETTAEIIDPKEEQDKE